MNNPDGANYSYYNFASQRRNMTNHCVVGGKVTDDPTAANFWTPALNTQTGNPFTNTDPASRNAWGVDLNRNYRFASGFDGYDGADESCTSDTFQGPAKLSEPESKNSIWLADNFPNIKFFMSVHSNGGQLFWQPGAYIAAGRVTAPRPSFRDEAFYMQSADRILTQVKAERQTVVTPENVGGSADVLYSSAGNVREDLYNNYGIYAFGWEVGGSVYNTATGNFQGGSFQPAWVGNPDLVSGHSETMEYANGVMEMFRIAADWGKDKVRPKIEARPRARPVHRARRRPLRDERAGRHLLHDGRLACRPPVGAVQGDRVPRARSDVPRHRDDDLPLVLRRRRGQLRARLRPGQPRHELPPGGDQDRRASHAQCGRGAGRRPARVRHRDRLRSGACR